MHNLLAEPLSKTILERVADDSSSLIVTTYSRNSRLATPCPSPDNSVLDDTEFDFDHEVINTQAYRRVFMNLQRRNMSADREITSNTKYSKQPSNQALEAVYPATADDQVTRNKETSLNPLLKSQLSLQSPPRYKTSNSRSHLTQKDWDTGMALMSFEDRPAKRSPPISFARKSPSSEMEYPRITNPQSSLLKQHQFGNVIAKDSSYFTRQCQIFFQEIQSWVRRFSNLSYCRPCHLATEFGSNDPLPFSIYKVPLLNSSEVDFHLADQLRRKNVFMSWLSTILWRYIFSRYLFGIDKEQRRHVRAVERLLANTGEQTHFLIFSPLSTG